MPKPAVVGEVPVNPLARYQGLRSVGSSLALGAGSSSNTDPQNAKSQPSIPMPFICSNNKAHIFDTETPDGYCPTCDWGEGFLQETGTTGDVARVDSTVVSALPKEIGLAILLMDASESMFTEKAYA